VKTKNILFLAAILAAALSLSYVATSITPFRGFIVNLPSEVAVNAGQTVVLNGSIQNIGFYWEHEFNLTYGGLPSDYNVIFTPQYWQDMMTIRAWDPVNGLYKVPVPFNVTVVIPSDAITGVYAFNVTGQEFQSSRYVHNSSMTILKVAGTLTNTTTTPNATEAQGVLSISQIIVPETVEEFKPFNISFDIVNSGTDSQNVNISLQGPSDWTLTAPQSVLVPAGGSLPLVFSAIPTSTAGSLAVVLTYPYQQTILNITKAGPYLVPTSASATSAFSSMFSTTSLVSFVQQNAVLTIIIAIVILILIWYFVSTYSFYSKRKKPEEMKKKDETEKKAIEEPKTIEEQKATEPKAINTSSQDEAIIKQ
jgi:hypothetical protein